MRKILPYILLHVSVVAYATTQTRETTLTRHDKGLLGAMKRMHCSSQWLSVVMSNNGILESELTRLEDGMRVIIPEDCSLSQLPHGARGLTQKIFVREHQLSQTQHVVEEYAHLQEEFVTLTNTLEAQNAEIVSLGKTLTKLRLELKEEKLRKVGGKQTFSQRPAGIFGFITGVFLSMIALVLSWQRWRQTVEIVPKRQTLVFAGKIIVFNLVNDSWYYGCPLCSAQDVTAEHLERHLNRKHSSLRLVIEDRTGTHVTVGD
jgi:hypothetical protein